MYAVTEGTPGGFSPRGGALQLWKSRDHELMLSGPSETGKTYSALQKLNALLWKYPRCQSVIIRKTLTSLYTSVLKTYKNVLGPESPVTFYGGEKPEWADYPNGSRVFFAGMDNPQKALSSERDFIYVNQAEELSVEDWETLTTRCTGRAANAPYSQIFADCNPGPPTHWILHRPSLKVLESRHEHNPTLFDESGMITERGKRTIEILDRLTGVRKERLRHGRWVQAEGAVYEEWDRAIHLIDPFPIPSNWRRIRSIDFGFTNPFSCGWYAVDGDGRIYLYREIYRTQMIVSDHARKIAELTASDRIEVTVADHDAEDRATLDRGQPPSFGRQAVPAIPTKAAYKLISPGIQAVQARLRPAGDGRPRLFVFKDSLVDRDESLAEKKAPTCTADEFEVYMWPKGGDGRAIKEVPLDRDNHGLDQLRYAVAYVDDLANLGNRKVQRGPALLPNYRG